MLFQAQARSWFETLAIGKSAPMNDLAKRESLNPADISRDLPLAVPAPDIVPDGPNQLWVRDLT